MRLRLLPLAAVPVALAMAAPAVAAPTCVDVPEVLCGGRVVAEPELSTTFHQFDGPLESLETTLAAIEEVAPRYLEVMTLAEATGDPAHQSKGGRPIWVVRVTDEQAPRAGKAQVAVSLSVHGLEAAGREGGLRYLEDLARWGAGEPDHLLYAGDTGLPFSDVMTRTETWIAFTNSDGWAAGDLTSMSPGPGFSRGNEEGQDLNRDFATVGWYDRISGDRGVAESEPEIAGWTDLVRSFPNLVTSTDIHGELTTPNDAFSDLIIPAGQWTPKRQDQVNQLSLDMIRTVERKFDEEGIVLDDVLALLPVDGTTPRRPANVAASYDIVGYDDSGFMGDWFSQTQDSVHMDVENFLTQPGPEQRVRAGDRAGARRRRARQHRGHHRRGAGDRRGRAERRPRPGRLRRRRLPHQLRPGCPGRRPRHRLRPRRRARRRCRTTSAGWTTSPCCARPSAPSSTRSARPTSRRARTSRRTTRSSSPTWRCRTAAPRSTAPPTSRRWTPSRSAAGSCCSPTARSACSTTSGSSPRTR